MMLSLTSICLASLVGTAHAGGVGITATGGFHGANAYYYDDAGEQYIDGQQRPNAGAMIEALLGNKTERVQGVMRFGLVTDAPLNKPTLEEGLNPDNVSYPPADEQGWYNHGVALAGVQWSLYGEPDEFQLILNTMIGSGFWTIDNLEYAEAEVAPGITYMLSDNLQLTGSLAADLRYRKKFSTAENAYLGVRYMFH